MADKSIFETLNTINVNDKTEKKGKLTYLSWAWAWERLKENFPLATSTIYERETEFGPVNYFTDGRYCWVKTGVTIDGLEHIEELPVLDNCNKPIPLEKVTSWDVNTSIQRSLTKAIARHGLGLYVYAGEDLPTNEQEEKKAADEDKRLEAIATLKKTAKKNQIEWIEKEYGNIDGLTFEKADGLTKQIIRQNKEGKNDGSAGGS